MIVRPQFGQPKKRLPVPEELPPVSTDPINMAHIPIAGLGGMGLVVMAIVTAVVLPQAGVPVAAGLLLGVVLAVVLIMWRARRRRRAPEPPSRQIPR